jgi:hypothetical protein
MNVGFRRIRGLFPTHNPTHNIRCLVRLPRILAVPTALKVVVKPDHAALIKGEVGGSRRRRPLLLS